MNFQNLLTVQDAQHYMDTAFKQAKNRADIFRAKNSQKERRPLPIQPDKRRYVLQKIKLNASKDIELERMRIVQRSICGNLEAILKSFPSIDTLPLFYLELLKVTIEYPQMKRSLGAVNWALQKIDGFHNQIAIKIKRTHDIKLINQFRRHFYGRASSILKQINENLLFLEQCRKIMKRYPAIKTSVPSIALAGYPNVGKSTLLRAMTTSKPEVAPYAFTTKDLNVGYMKLDHHEFQMIDIPGTFDRSFEEMNFIEKQAYLVLKHLAKVIVFVIDPTETCGYTLEKQLQLLQRFEGQFFVPIIIVNNKVDLGAKEILREHLNISAENGLGIDELKKKIVEKC